VDTRTIISNYLRKTDWRVRENANTGYSFSGLALRMSEDAIADYMINTVYTQELKEASENCYIKIHDSGYCCTYCVGHDLKKLLNEGLNGVPNKVNTSPPKHMNSAVNIMVNYLGIMQMESAGAQAFPNFSILLAPFAKNDNEDYDTIKQHIQNFIYHMNISNRWGAQAVFSNITLDFSVPSYLKGTTPLVGGKDAEFTYDDCIEEMNMINKAVFEIMKDGDASGQPFAFPIITVDITKDFPWDSEISKLVFKTTAKYGLPYFQNYIGSDLDPDDVLAMCCRLQVDKRELQKHTGGLFGSGISTGSLQVVTLNLPKYAYEAKGNVGKFFELVKKHATLAKELHEIKREFLNEQMKYGLYPYMKRYIGSFKTFFSTIGIVGGNEACLNLIGQDISTYEGKKLMENTLKYLRELIADFQEETGHMYNVEATPAESTAYKLARFDKKQYPDIITSGTEETPYYTNSTHLKVDVDVDIPDLIEHQESLQLLYNSGTVVHFYLGEQIKSWRSCMKLVKRIATNSAIPYFSITPTFSVCPLCGYVTGEHEFCPNKHSEEELEKHGLEVQKNDENTM